MRSPGYASLINRISEIWQNVDEQMIARRFDLCGITSNTALSEILKKVLESNEPVTDYVIDEPGNDEVVLGDVDLFDVEVVPV
jgi:hypothetical protein